MKIDWFDLTKPIQLHFTDGHLKNPDPIVFPLKLTRVSNFIKWNCIWCSNSYYQGFGDIIEPLPMLLLGCCSLKPYISMHLRCKTQHCGLFHPLPEYIDLIKAKLMILEFRISNKDFLFL